MNAWRWVDPRIRDLTRAHLTTYMLQHGWVLKPNANSAFLRFEQRAFLVSRGRAMLVALAAGAGDRRGERNMTKGLTYVSGVPPFRGEPDRRGARRHDSRLSTCNP